jgi:CheY-like chemotaxis protein
MQVTGYGQHADRRRSKEVGFDHHLTKPVDPNALREFVSTHA